jgi:undecaprenyl-diphosphatase
MVVPLALTVPVDLILRWDTRLFYFMNGGIQNEILDLIMPILSDFHHWRWPLVAVALMALLLGKSKVRVTILLILVAVSLSDQISSALLKPLVARPRPSHVLEGVRLLAGRGGRYGFPSSHAANIFAVWTVLALRHRKVSLFLAAIPLGVAYSRVYLGVHYPLDVLGGAILGWLIALVAVNVYQMFSSRVARFRAAGGRSSSRRTEEKQ